VAWANGWSVAASFDGEFSNVTNSHAGKGAIRYRGDREQQQERNSLRVMERLPLRASSSHM
jgi:hypothetical protein